MTDIVGLLPCPFCNHPVHIIRGQTEGSCDWIEHLGSQEECGLEFSDFNLTGDLATAWNTRAAYEVMARSEQDVGASVPDQALAVPVEPEDRLDPAGFDPSRSMVPYGPDHPDYPNAPSDWDGGPYLCRDGQLYHMRGYGWGHGLGCWKATADWDRIAYRPASAIEAMRHRRVAQPKARARRQSRTPNRSGSSGYEG